MIPVIYRVDAAGSPTTLVVRGTEVVIAANRPAGWITSTLPAVRLPSGSYLLGLLSGPSGIKARLRYTPAANRGIWNVNPYGTPSSSWGQANRDESLWSVYVTYTTSDAPPPPPASSAPPAISGTPEVGRTLTASAGTWSGTPASYAYRWRRCSAGTCADIQSATQSSYLVASADVGSTLLVVVTATNASGSASAASAQTAPVAGAPPSPPPPPPPPSRHPSRHLPPRHRRRAPSAPPRPEPRTSSPGDGYKFGSVHRLDATATPTNFRWYARGGSRGTVVCSRSSTARTPRDSHEPRDAGAGGRRRRGPAGRLDHDTAPVRGDARSGRYLLGLLSGPQGGSAFVYYDDGPAEAAWWNANGSSTPTQTWGALNSSGQRWSIYVELQSDPPARRAARQRVAPSISGTAVVGQTLTASTGTWTNSPTSYGYQWRRCQGTACSPVDGATSSTSVLTSADEGRSLRSP